MQVAYTLHNSRSTRVGGASKNFKLPSAKAKQSLTTIKVMQGNAGRPEPVKISPVKMLQMLRDGVSFNQIS